MHPVPFLERVHVSRHAGDPLRIASLAKQVPLAESLRLEDGRLVRSGVEFEMNPYCRRAVAEGVSLARDTRGTCTVVTLGPASAEDVLREAVAWGADTGLHVCDPAFAGSDSLATARALAGALQAAGRFDLILLGRNSIDGETGQMGPELAELLGLPFASGVRGLEDLGSHLRLELEHDDGSQDVEVDVPAVLYRRGAPVRSLQGGSRGPCRRPAGPAHQDEGRRPGSRPLGRSRKPDGRRRDPSHGARTLPGPARGAARGAGRAGGP